MIRPADDLTPLSSEPVPHDSHKRPRKGAHVCGGQRKGFTTAKGIILSGISGDHRGLTKAAEKLRTKKGRVAAAAVTGTVVLAGALAVAGVNAHANDVHKQQNAAAEAAQVASAQASSDAASKAAADQAAAEKAASDKASASAAAKAAADKAAADKAAADKAAAEKAAADKALADRAAAAAAANRDLQRQPITLTAPTTAPTTSAPAASYGSPQAIAEQIVPAGQFGCFSWIISRESGWDVHATNPSSGAYGLPQALPGSKMASAGSDWQNNPATQIKWALSYMDSRYGSPCGAEAFWQSNGWY